MELPNTTPKRERMQDDLVSRTRLRERYRELNIEAGEIGVNSRLHSLETIREIYDAIESGDPGHHMASVIEEIDSNDEILPDHKSKLLRASDSLHEGMGRLAKTMRGLSERFGAEIGSDEFNEGLLELIHKPDKPFQGKIDIAYNRLGIVLDVHDPADFQAITGSNAEPDPRSKDDLITRGAFRKLLSGKIPASVIYVRTDEDWHEYQRPQIVAHESRHLIYSLIYKSFHSDDKERTAKLTKELADLITSSGDYQVASEGMILPTIENIRDKLSAYVQNIYRFHITNEALAQGNAEFVKDYITSYQVSALQNIVRTIQKTSPKDDYLIRQALLELCNFDIHEDHIDPEDSFLPDNVTEIPVGQDITDNLSAITRHMETLGNVYLDDNDDLFALLVLDPMENWKGVADRIKRYFDKRIVPYIEADEELHEEFGDQAMRLARETITHGNVTLGEIAMNNDQYEGRKREIAHEVFDALFTEFETLKRKAIGHVRNFTLRYVDCGWELERESLVAQVEKVRLRIPEWQREFQELEDNLTE